MVGARVSPRMVMLATLLPQPDSPTMPSGLAGVDGEVDAVDGLDDAVLGVELNAEVVDLEQGAHWYRTLGSR